MADLAHVSIAKFLERRLSDTIDDHPFWYFEPFDVKKRPDWVEDLALKDGIDLHSPELAELIGHTPHPFQSGYLLSTARCRTLLAGTQVGKAQPYDSTIYGEFGVKKMGDIKVGDKVFGQDARLHSVLQIYEQGEQDVYRLEFEDESSVECTSDHLWTIYKPGYSTKQRWSHGVVDANPLWMQTVVMPLGELLERYGFVPRTKRRWAIGLAEKVSWETVPHVIPSYSLGVLLGDGNYTQSNTSFTCHAKSVELIERVGREIGIYRKSPAHPGKVSTFFVSRRRENVRNELDRMGLGGKKSQDKFIPREYLYDSADNRLDLLRGLMDTDGSIYGRCQCEYYSKSKQLAMDVMWLVHSLGGKARIRTKKAHYTKNGIRVDCGIGYRVKVVMGNDNPFFIKRKACRWYKISQRVDVRRIKSVSYAGRKKCRCLLVDNADHTYLTDNFIVTHNSYATFIELGIQVSGEKPISLRFEKGVKTGVKRKISKENIHRFGRFDSITGEFIDFNIKAEQSLSCDEWDCGYIEGAGIYPDEKILEPGEVCWVGTTQKALQELWWERLVDPKSSILPVEFINARKGNEGASKLERVVHCVRDTHISIISYESGYRKFEAADRVRSCVFDEESIDEACENSAIFHCKYFSRVMTPYNGMTYTRKKIFDSNAPRKDNAVFHCTEYDSPYCDVETIKFRRSIMPPYEVGARIWGLHTEAGGKPYFDRQKINTWIRAFRTPYRLCKFFAASEYDGVKSRPDHSLPGLMSVDVIREPDIKEENKQDVWRVYEELDEGGAYFLMADSAEGSDIPSESADVLASLVMRPPVGDEKYPQIVASLRSTLKTQNFSRVCLAAARYWNNALMCAEGPTRGSFNALFYAEAKDYPFWFLQSSIRDSTRKARNVKGFDTNAATRGAIFDAIRELLDEFDATQRPEINDEPLLIELSACVIAIKNGKARPDHTEQSSLDTSVCWGQGMYVWKHYASQIRCRASPKSKGVGFRERMMPRIVGGAKPLYLGGGQEPLR